MRSALRVLRVVVDSNIWINALYGGTNGLAVVESLEQDRIQLVFAEELLAELAGVLTRPKFARIPLEKRERLLALIREKATFVKLESSSKVCRDPKDEMYLVCASTAQADLLVSGDEDLLCLIEHDKTRIVTLRQFRDILDHQI